MTDGEQTNFTYRLPRTEAISSLNDNLRKRARGGRILVTKGVLTLDGFDTATLLAALAEYDSFDAHNDPHGEHDFGDLTAFGADLLWKIDYYDERLEFGSADPSNPKVTTRVLTIMLEQEY